MKRRSMRRSARSEMLAIRTVGVDRGASPQPQEPLWTDLAPSLPTSSPLEGTVQADVCVVGLGAAGLSAVIHLTSRGVNVVGIDAGPLGGTATVRTAGMWFAGLPMFHHDAIEILGRKRATALYQETRKELAALTAAGDLTQRWSGSLRLASSDAEHDDCARQLEVMRRDGLPVEAYDGDEGHGLLFPEDGAFQPVERVRSLIEAAQAAGAQLYGSTRAQQLGDRDIDSTTGEVRCRSVIVAVDGGLEHMVPALNGVVMTGRVQALAASPAAIALSDLPPPSPPPSLPPTGITPPDITPPNHAPGKIAAG
ncbi:MAG: FAD-dependent oxidoreductase, partial [Nitriliruptoraceae bacterium]